MRKVALCLRAALCGAVMYSVGSVAQVPDRPDHHQHAHPAPVAGNFGELSFPNSGNKVAQAPFLRGVKLLHNFQYEDAIDAFQQAEKADPTFALAYWGEAMAHNYSLWSEQQTDDARAALAKLGTTPEARAGKAKTAREKMWLAAVEALYGPGSKFERDVAYADRMDALHAAYPNDLEARVFDALATMGRSHGARDISGYMKAAAMLEEVFPTHMHHPGVVHYLIHAYDDPAHAPLGIRAARLYDKIAPDSAHAQHMTSHIFLALGMWPETEAANLRAATVQDQMMAQHHMPPNHCGHGNIWLVYAKLQQAKDVSREIDSCRADLERGLKGAKDLPVASLPEGLAGSWTHMALYSGIETGRWPQWVDLPTGHLTFARFFEDYGRLLAARHDAKAAEAALNAMEADRAVLAVAYPKEQPDDDQTLLWVDRAVAQAEAVVALARGNRDQGLKLLRAAAEAEAALPQPFGPPELQKPSFEMLGDELLALGQKTDAAEAYKKALAAAPNRRLSVAGLKAATAP